MPTEPLALLKKSTYDFVQPPPPLKKPAPSRPLTFEDLVVPPNTLVLAWILALRNYEQNLSFVLIGCVISTRLFPSETLPANSIIVLLKN